MNNSKNLDIDNILPNKPNPFNSPSFQVLLDLKKALAQTGCHLYMLDDILENFADECSDLRDECDKIFMAHNYNPKNVKFVQSVAYEICPERFELPSVALKILDFLERMQSPSGYVEFQKSQLVEILHLTDSERKGLQKTLDLLEETGFIEAVYKPPKGSKLPCQYKINRSVTWAGKQEPIENKIALHNKIKTSKPFEPKYTRGCKQIKINQGSKIVNCCFLEPCKRPPEAQKKIEFTATNNEPDNSTKENIPSLCPNVNCNNNEPKNQDVDVTENNLTQMTIYDILGQASPYRPQQ